MKVNLFDLLDIYESEVKKNVRNKKKILDFEKHKMEYLVDIKRVLENNLYDGGKYNKFYFLKLDISKYFYNLDHEVIISIVKQDLNPDELNLVKIILESTNKEYINKKIKYLENKYNVELPKY